MEDLSWTTMNEIRAKAEGAVKAKVDALYSDKKNPRVAARREAELAKLRGPEWERWIDGLAEPYRRRGLLLTDQQMADLRAKRQWREGDRARYIGPSRPETTSTGALVMRQHGQVGTIVDVLFDEKKHAIVRFQPDPPEEAVVSHETGEIVRYTVKQGTPAFLELERVPAPKQ